MNDMQKITVRVPAALLHRAQAATGTGITETVCFGLDRLVSANAAGELRRRRGTVRLALDTTALRRDRRI